MVTGGSDEKGPGLFKLPIGGGEQIRLTSTFATAPAWSPDRNSDRVRGCSDRRKNSVKGSATRWLAVRTAGALEWTC